MNEFLYFFDRIVKKYPMHLEIYYSQVCDWNIYIYKKGCGENGTDLCICNVQDCDIELAFAKAHVELKEFLIKYNDGY